MKVLALFLAVLEVIPFRDVFGPWPGLLITRVYGTGERVSPSPPSKGRGFETGPTRARRYVFLLQLF